VIAGRRRMAIRRQRRPAMKKMIAWLRARASPTAPGKIRLSREELDALTATPAGHAIFEANVDRLDLSACEPTEAELAALLGA
jgi:hypothetical protein